MNADDSARLHNLLANNRTLLAYIRTALAFAGLGFAVAKFGLSPSTERASGYLGTFMVLVGAGDGPEEAGQGLVMEADPAAQSGAVARGAVRPYQVNPLVQLPLTR